MHSSQLEQLRNNLENINYEVAEAKEKELRHDVMSHIHAYGMQCPEAMPIIHLGATRYLPFDALELNHRLTLSLLLNRSQYVNDNTEILQLHGSLDLIKTKTLVLIDHLSEFANKYKDMPTLGFTHFQAGTEYGLITKLRVEITLFWNSSIGDRREARGVVVPGLLARP